MSDQYSQIFTALSQCNHDQLMVFRSFIETQLNRPTWNTPYLTITAPPAPIAVQPPPPPPTFSTVAAEKPRDIVATSKPIAHAVKQPTDWCVDENGDHYTFVCSKGALCGCRVYPEYQTTPFSKHEKHRVNSVSLYLFGLDPLQDYEEVRKHIIDIIGEDTSKSIYVPQGMRYGFVTFKNHTLAVNAQKAFDLYNQYAKKGEQILANFALKQTK